MDYNRIKPRKNKPAKKVKPPVKTANMKMKTLAGAEARKNYHLQTKSYNKKVGIIPAKKKVRKK